MIVDNRNQYRIKKRKNVVRPERCIKIPTTSLVRNDAYSNYSKRTDRTLTLSLPRSAHIKIEPKSIQFFYSQFICAMYNVFFFLHKPHDKHCIQLQNHWCVPRNTSTFRIEKYISLFFFAPQLNMPRMIQIATPNKRNAIDTNWIWVKKYVWKKN